VAFKVFGQSDRAVAEQSVQSTIKALHCGRRSSSRSKTFFTYRATQSVAFPRYCEGSGDVYIEMAQVMRGKGRFTEPESSALQKGLRSGEH